MRLDEQYVLGTYKRNPVCFVKGEGSYLWDDSGRRYIDFFPGWGVSVLGHCHPAVVEAIRRQAGLLIHMPNNFLNPLQPLLAKALSELSFGGKCFFCNSGAEANEAAIKLARAWGSGKGRYEIITLLKSFHGRTYGALSATGQEKYHNGLGPMLPGFKYAGMNDFKSLEAAVTDKTVAVMMEPIQGEGGVNPAGAEYMKDVARLCETRGLLLIFDEVQTAMGRTGSLFAYQKFGVTPHVMTLAKGLGAGVPVGAMVCSSKIAGALKPGMHASTFGGNPLVCAVALEVLSIVSRKEFLEEVAGKGEYLKGRLDSLMKRYPVITQVRGMGLMLGAEFARDAEKVFQKALEKGLVLNCTSGSVIRFMPALTVEKSVMDQALEIFEEVLKEIS